MCLQDGSGWVSFVMTVHALFMYATNPYGGVEVVTTANSGVWRGLSPFVLPATKYGSRTFENLWQYSKVYSEFLEPTNLPSEEWYEWRQKGFNNPRAVRYPMGRGRVPAYSYWNGQRLSYVEARKAIYAPIYAELVAQTDAYKRLCSLHESLHDDEKDLVLRDYDAYDHIKLGVSLREVINNPNKKMGHAFVLAMMLTNCLEECLS